jgi:hypothetical protein
MPMGQFEQRLLNLERAVMRLFVELGRILARFAGLEQSNWQAWGSVGGGTSAGIQITQPDHRLGRALCLRRLELGRGRFGHGRQ